MPSSNIVIIGGGSSGLSIAGALKQYGLSATILDSSSRTGDVWRKRYERLHLHTIKSLSHSAYKKLDASLPRYASKDEFADYLTDYAQEFELDIRYNTQVTRISKDESGYRIETQNGDIWQAEHCIIATGVNRIPYIPDWSSMDAYQGTITHAIHHKTGKDYKGKRILVVGIGNTGAEICADCVEQGASYVANSIRTFPMIIKRDPLGIPVHIWGVLLFPFPVGFKDWLVNTIAKFELGDLSLYGINTPEWHVFRDKRIPMIDVGYIKELKAGNITVKADIAKFTEHGVQFTDGTQEDYDAVIAGTGYRTGLENILDIPDVIDAEGNVIAENGENAPHKGLWFIGLLSSPAGVLMAARIQSRSVAKMIASEYGKLE
ncbi:MAG: NAD(P)/FAD-dependent oxidoreductase [Phototrophicaceae bacterium]